jgi:hypothetical protein
LGLALTTLATLVLGLVSSPILDLVQRWSAALA